MTCVAMLIPITVKAAGEVLPTISISTGSGQETPSYSYGQQKELIFNVTNEGSAEAKNVKISPMLDANTDGWPFEIESMNYDQDFDHIAAGQTIPVKYNWKARQDVADKYYKLGFNITYDDGTKAYKTDKYAFVKMNGKKAATPTPTPPSSPKEPTQDTRGTTTGISNYDPMVSGGGSADSAGGAASGSIPRVIVTGFNTDPAEVKAGNNFKLIIHLKNTSTSTGVKNMLFNLSAPTEGKDENNAPAFLPVSGASSIYMDSIPAGGVADITLDLNAKADLVQKPYTVEVAMKYENQSNAQFDSTSMVSVPVKQAPRFEFSEFEINPSPATVGEEANIMCNLYNLGRTKLYNVKAKYVGKSISSKEVFIGNVESGGTAAIDTMIKAEKETAQGEKIKMILTYEDDANQVTTVEKETAFEVQPATADSGMAMQAAETKKKSLPILPIVIGIVVIIGVITGIIIRKKKKKREGVFEDEFVGLIEDEQQ